MDAGDWVWIWIGAALLLAFAELVTPFLFFMISFAVGAAAAAITAAFDVAVGWQWAAFVIMSSVALTLLVPIGRRLARSGATDEQMEGATRWVGRLAVVIEEIPSGPHETGLVRLERAQWRAETPGDVAIAVGTNVEVLEVRGTRLLVVPVDPEQPSTRGSGIPGRSERDQN